MEIFQNQPLAPYTTLKIGGPADTLVLTSSHTEFVDALKTYAGQPITILGNGSNVLISDSGIRGVVIKNSSSQIDILKNSDSTTPVKFHKSDTQRTENEPEKYLDFTKLDYDESAAPQVLVKISSGTPLPYAVNWLLENGITGLQWFAYIPGTIGGATWYNIHGGAYHIADFIDSVEVFNLDTSEISQLPSDKLQWSYEISPFQKSPRQIILSTTFRLFWGDTELAKKVRDAWIAQKIKIQPMNSAGSAFANPSLADCLPIWGEQKSAGWIIDHELDWKGRIQGGAQISPLHANFIVNANHATADDYYRLLTDVQAEVLRRFDLKLTPEIRLLGNFS